MEVKSISTQGFGIMPPPVYINTVSETLPAIIQNAPAINRISVAQKYFTLPLLPKGTSLPNRKPLRQDKFILNEAILTDFKIRVPGVKGKKNEQIITKNLKKEGRSHKDGKIIWY